MKHVSTQLPADSTPTAKSWALAQMRKFQGSFPSVFSMSAAVANETADAVPVLTLQDVRHLEAILDCGHIYQAVTYPSNRQRFLTAGRDDYAPPNVLTETAVIGGMLGSHVLPIADWRGLLSRGLITAAAALTDQARLALTNHYEFG